MRRQYRIGQAKQRVSGVQGFGGEYIQPRRRQMAGFESPHQGRLIYQAAARGIHQDSAWLHAGKCCLIDQTARFRRFRDMEGDQIGFRQKRVQRAKGAYRLGLWGAGRV